jgi:hypothetical protein
MSESKLTLLLPKGSIDYANRLLCAEMHNEKQHPDVLDILVRTNSIVQANLETLENFAILIHVDTTTEQLATLPPDEGWIAMHMLDTRFRLLHLIDSDFDFEDFML